MLVVDGLDVELAVVDTARQLEINAAVADLDIELFAKKLKLTNASKDGNFHSHGEQATGNDMKVWKRRVDPRGYLGWVG